MKALGYAIIVDPTAPTKEADSITCFHCNAVFFIRASSPDFPVDLGGFCRLCYQHICGACADLGKCDPFEAKLERMERMDITRRKYESIL